MMRARIPHYLALIVLICGVSIPLDQASAASQPKVKLAVRVDLETGETFRWTLNCRPNSGNHPAINATCNFLSTNAGRKVLNPKPASTSCLQIFGGDSKAKITGTFYGKRVSLDLDRRDGCKIAQWESLIRIVRYR
jgi:hypothetical protein